MRDISMHILDIAQNSIRAKASLVCISITADENKDVLNITIEDDGIGMDAELLKRVQSPFATTRETRNVGLGIPLLAASCQRTGKSLEIESQLGLGTKLSACYGLSHIDRPPLGDVAETVYTLTMLNPGLDFVCTFKQTQEFVYDTRQIRQTLGEVPITNIDVLEFIKEYLSEGITQIFGGSNI